MTAAELLAAAERLEERAEQNDLFSKNVEIFDPVVRAENNAETNALRLAARVLRAVANNETMRKALEEL